MAVVDQWDFDEEEGLAWVRGNAYIHHKSEGVGPERTAELRALFISGDLGALCTGILQSRCHSKLDVPATVTRRRRKRRF